LQAFFLDSVSGATAKRFVIHHEPLGTPRGALVAVYPFAEEMNKSRRMIALGARALAHSGYGVLQLDLAGCGDSTGNLVDTRWDTWLDDVAQALDWLEQRYQVPLWLWGTRAGCLVAAAAARRWGRPLNFLFWQPQSSGKQVLQQFLRLKMASQIQHGATKGMTDALQKELAAGRPVDVAGYLLGADIAQGLSSATMVPPPEGRQMCWFEVTAREPAELLHGSGPVLNTWRSAGFAVQALAVNGPPFWQTLEIEAAPALVSATLAALDAHAESAAR
jgi:uncharacterized protein